MAAYTAARPAVALITSASVERNAVIGDNVAARAADIPIVQLNPAGALNWKYKGETALRESGVACAPHPARQRRACVHVPRNEPALINPHCSYCPARWSQPVAHAAWVRLGVETEFSAVRSRRTAEALERLLQDGL